MRRLQLCLVLSALVFAFAGCCSFEKRAEPQLPSQVSGWNERTEKWLKIKGEFILRKSDPVQNDEIKMELREIIPGRQCAEPGTFQRNPRVKIRFESVPELQNICETEISENTSGSFPRSCRDEMASNGITGFEVLGINVKDGWVLVRLLG